MSPGPRPDEATKSKQSKAKQSKAAPMLGPSLVVGICGWIAWCEGVTDVSVHSCETSCLSMRVEGHVGGYISVPARTQISWDLIPTDIDGDPQSVGPGLVDPIRPGCCR